MVVMNITAKCTGELSSLWNIVFFFHFFNGDRKKERTRRIRRHNSRRSILFLKNKEKLQVGGDNLE